jgi:YD repeat-containing protein
MKRKMLLLTLALPVILGQATFAQQSRLVSQAHWANNGATFTPVDSTNYNYSSGRGGDLTHHLNFDNSTTWSFDTGGVHNQMYYIQTFDAHNNVTSEIAEIWNTTTSAWDLFSNTLFTYNSANQATTMILQTWNGVSWTPVSQDVYTYFSNGKLQTDQYQTWNSLTTMFDPTSQKTYYYDPSGNLINETDNNFVLGTPIYTSQWVNTFSATNQLLTTTMNTWSGTAWQPMNLTTNTYDTSGNLINKVQQTYDVPSASWMNSTQDVYSNFKAGTHLPQTDVLQHWDATSTGTWANTMEFTNTYNSFNQLTSTTGMSWNIVGIFEFALGDPMANYHYGTYSSAVKNVTNAGGDAKIYPVPAQNTLHIDLKWDVAQAATITITDAKGSVVRQWNAPMGLEYSSAVSVDNLSVGVYFIKINGAEGQIVKSLVVSR